MSRIIALKYRLKEELNKLDQMHDQGYFLNSDEYRHRKNNILDEYQKALAQAEELEAKQYMSQKKEIQELKSSNSYSMSSDERVQCSYCYTNHNTFYIGQMLIDGSQIPAYKCTRCSKSFAKMPNNVKALADVAKNEGAEEVGFVPAGEETAHNVASPEMYGSPSHAELQMVNSNLNNLAAQITSLNSTIVSLVEQNARLMDQLATDPLVTVRKKVAEFELK